MRYNMVPTLNLEDRSTMRNEAVSRDLAPTRIIIAMTRRILDAYSSCYCSGCVEVACSLRRERRKCIFKRRPRDRRRSMSRKLEERVIICSTNHVRVKIIETFTYKLRDIIETVLAILRQC